MYWCVLIILLSLVLLGLSIWTLFLNNQVQKETYHSYAIVGENVPSSKRSQLAGYTPVASL